MRNSICDFPVNTDNELVKNYFDEKGTTHKTIIGGILTILYYLFIVGYTAYCFYKLFYHAQDSDNHVTTSLDLA